MVMYRWILLRVKKASGRNCRENLCTFYVPYISSWNRVFMRMWENMILQDRTYMTIYCSVYALHAGYLNLQTHTHTHTHTHTECVILITFARLQCYANALNVTFVCTLPVLLYPWIQNCPILKMEALHSFEASVTIYQSTRRGISENWNLDSNVFSHTRCLSSEIR